jgi:hypothetical protein
MAVHYRKHGPDQGDAMGFVWLTAEVFRWICRKQSVITNVAQIRYSLMLDSTWHFVARWQWPADGFDTDLSFSQVRH